MMTHQERPSNLAAARPARRAGPAKAGGVARVRIASKLYRGLADQARLGLLVALRDGPRPAGELADRTGLSPSRASNHLLCLLECGLVQVEPDGRRNVYRLADPAVGRLLDASDDLLGRVGPLIEACLNYGPPTRRSLRPVRRRDVIATQRAAAGAVAASAQEESQG